MEKRFQPLSDLVDSQNDINVNNMEVVSFSNSCSIGGVKNKPKQKRSKEGTGNERGDQITGEKYKSTNIVRDIQQGKAPGCVRGVDVNEIVDKCSDLKECIKQQRNPYGFLPISNLKRMQRVYSLKPNSIITNKDFDLERFTNRSRTLANTIMNKPRFSFRLI